MRTRQVTVPGMSQIEFMITQIIGDNTQVNQSEPHIHSDCEIYINLGGDVSFEVEGQLYPISRGSVVVTRPYEYHRCIRHSQAGHDHLWITFSAVQEEDYLWVFFDRKKGHRNLIVLEENVLEQLCRVIDQLVNSDQDLLMQRILMLQMFHILNQGKSKEPLTDLAKLPPDVQATLRYMEEHLAEEIDIHLLAQLSNVSIHTLERHFKQALGTLPAETLRDKRLFVSLQLLRNGETVANAASKSGFSDYSHYIQLFRKRFGITPFKYQKNFKR